MCSSDLFPSHDNKPIIRKIKLEPKLPPHEIAMNEIDTSSLSLRKAHSEWWKTKQDKLRNAFNKSRVDAVSVRTDQDFVKALLTLFEKRN